MAPGFEKALADKRITAWVCINDELGAIALHYLAAQPTERAARISVVGFDNSVLAMETGLTSVDLRYDALGRFAFECIARPRMLREVKGPLIRAQVQTIERSSTQKRV